MPSSALLPLGYPCQPASQPHQHGLNTATLRRGLLGGALAGVLLGFVPGLSWGAAPVATTAKASPGAPAAQPEFAEIMATRALLPRLQAGGYVLYMRHGNTNNDIPDQPRLDLNNCATQRPLNAEGRTVALQVGRALAQARIPVGKVFSSPLCRARETAEIAFGSRAQVDQGLMYTAHLTTAEKQPVLAHTRQLLSEPVAAGTNRVLVAHAPNLADLIGYFVKPEGTVVVFQPLGEGRFVYVASIPPGLWPQLNR